MSAESAAAAQKKPVTKKRGPKFTAAKKRVSQGEPIRLYVKGTFVGYKRSKVNQYNHTALLVLDGVKTAQESRWYQGKRVAYIYRAHTLQKGSFFRVIWGRITRPHGTNGTVRAKFARNLPPRGLGARVRVFLYPSRV